MNTPAIFMGVGFRLRGLFLLVATVLLLSTSLPVMALLAVGQPTIEWLANTPSAETATANGFYAGEPMAHNSYAWGNCTWWAYAMRSWAGSPIPNSWGNANTWDDRALRDGFQVNSTPAVGAIFQTDEGYYGHVAYVTDVDGSTGDWSISEMNTVGLNIVSRRSFTTDAASHYRFIHGKIGVPSQTP